MNAETPPTPTASDSQTAAQIKGTIERIRQTIAAQERRAVRGSRLTVIVGSVLCVLLVVYFYIGYAALDEALSSNMLIDSAEEMIVPQLPKARKALERQVQESAPEWAASLSAEIQSNMPQVRTMAEDAIVTRLEQGLDEFQLLTAEDFRQFLRENRPMLADGFDALGDPNKSKEFLAALGVAAEKGLATNIEERADDLLQTLNQLDHKLAVLAKGERVDSEEALERQILMIARRLEIDSAADIPHRSRTAQAERSDQAAPAAASQPEPADETAPPVDKPKDGSPKPTTPPREAPGTE